MGVGGSGSAQLFLSSYPLLRVTFVIIIRDSGSWVGSLMGSEHIHLDPANMHCLGSSQFLPILFLLITTTPNSVPAGEDIHPLPRDLDWSSLLGLLLAQIAEPWTWLTQEREGALMWGCLSETGTRPLGAVPELGSSLVAKAQCDPCEQGLFQLLPYTPCSLPA